MGGDRCYLSLAIQLPDLKVLGKELFNRLRHFVVRVDDLRDHANATDLSPPLLALR